MKLNNENWIQASELCDAPYFRKSFHIPTPSKAEIAICGLGFYEFYVNGSKINDHYFMPVTSDYHSRDMSDFLYPISGNFTHRTYYDKYDIGTYLVSGENVIAIALGNGWYNQHERIVEGHQAFGSPRLTFCLNLYGKEPQTIVSDESICWHRSEVVFNNLFYGEKHDQRLCLTGWQLPAFDDSAWKHVLPIPPMEGSILCTSDCPGDKVIRTLIPQRIHETASHSIYDAGENISGWVEITGTIKAGKTVRIRHADLLTQDGELDFISCGGTDQIQTLEYTGNGTIQTLHPKFSWQAFRYFEITGEFDGYGEAPILCAIVHSDIEQTSKFHCSNETLNWLYEAYIRTQLSNIHAGVPLDTPNRERLGYTGDGQLGCQAAMLTLDIQKLYEKWIQDILDCQDKISGRVQHTAPFQGGGGGPAAWGCAIVEIPYQYYIHYNEINMLKTCFAPMLHWFDYLESRSLDNLVVSGEDGGWCLGEWNASTEVSIPAPFVNTYFYVKSLLTASKIAQILGLPEESDRLCKRAKQKKEALKKNFYDRNKKSYCGGIQAANAFAADIGLFDADTLHSLNNQYASMNEFDTGIFGTDILIRVLFEHGYAQTAYNLLTADGTSSFENIRREGSTTLRESFVDKKESHNHPMFGSVTRYLFTNLLGIKYCGTSHVEVKPDIVEGLDYAEGMITTIFGTVNVKYVKREKDIEFWINCTGSMTAHLDYAGKGNLIVNNC